MFAIKLVGVIHDGASITLISSKATSPKNALEEPPHSALNLNLTKFVLNINPDKSKPYTSQLAEPEFTKPT